LNTEYFLQGLTLGLILIFIGFLFKIAAAPLHNCGNLYYHLKLRNTFPFFFAR